MFDVLGMIVVACPAVLLGVIGLSALFRHPLSEQTTARWTEACVVVGLLASILVLLMMLSTDRQIVPIEICEWVSIPQQHFHFTLKLVFDRLSVPFVILTFVLCGVIGAFASIYLHREQGYNRFFVFFAVFQLGMVMSSLAGTIETLFFGWELVGLSSALLVAFFHDRSGPVRNGHRVWVVYRFSDAAFLLAALMLHHLTSAGDFEGLMGQGAWPDGRAQQITQSQAFVVGMLLIVAAAGKSALVPFSGWLPRAMEGPTPSSAVFYGALSVHLGVFLLLRVSPILDRAPWLNVVLVVLGLASAAFAAMTARVQSDVKSALAFASLIQVSIMVVEVGLGLRYITLVHMIGHACLRTLQLLRAPSVLRDHRALEDALGDYLPTQKGWLGLPARLHRRAYRFAIERGYLDSFLDDFVVEPWMNAFRWSDRMERRWTNYLKTILPATSNGRSRDRTMDDQYNL